jgi:hypothetical protein
MLVPPQRDDLAARADPAKLRARKFNTGKGAKAPASAEGGGGIGGLWTETGEEKRRRLADEVMGIRPAAHLDAGASAGVEKPGGEGGRNVAEVRATDERIRAYNVRLSPLLSPPLREMVTSTQSHHHPLTPMR